MVTAKEEKEMKPAIEDCIVTAAASTPRRGRGRVSEGPAWFRVRRGAHQSGQSMGTAKYGKQLGLTRFNKHFSEVELNKGDTRAFVDLPHPTNDKTPVDGDDVPFFPQKQLQNLDLPVRRKLGELGGTISVNEQDLQMVKIDLLLTLTDNETKFLPPWAGGLNAGTSSVLENQLPPADKGPDGPGPAHHTSITIPSVASSLLGSPPDDISALHIADSATAASVDVLNNISTICRPDHFVARDMFPVDVPGKSTGQTVPQTLDEFPQAPGSDDDSIRFDDFDTLDDEDDDCQSS